MNYKKHYDLLIKRAQGRKLNCYTEKHHIIPKCIGGSKTDPKNIVALTAEEHYVAHQLLVKMYLNHPKHGELVFAAFRMTTHPNGQRNNNKIYGWIRERYSVSIRGKKHPMYGKKHSEETKKKMSRTHKNMSNETKKKIAKARLGKKHTEETKKKISNIRKDKKIGPMSEEHKRNISIACSGKRISKETRKKMSLAAIGRKHTEESKKKMSETKRRKF